MALSYLSLCRVPCVALRCAPLCSIYAPQLRLSPSVTSRSHSHMYMVSWYDLRKCIRRLPLPSDQLAVRRRAPPPPLVVRTSALSNAPPEAHDSHNKHRIASMSERALITRAWRITNLAKLESFVYTLRELGNREEVLAEAVAALTWRTTGVLPEESSSPATGKGAMNG